LPDGAPPAEIDKQSGVTFNATAGQETSGKVAEFHSDGKEPDRAQFTARIYWGDGTAKTDGTIQLKAGTSNDFEVHGKHTYAAGGTCKAQIEIKEPGIAQVVTVDSTANVSGTPGPPCGEGQKPPEPPKDPPKAAIADLVKKPRQS
jgi:hypothetical protein